MRCHTPFHLPEYLQFHCPWSHTSHDGCCAHCKTFETLYLTETYKNDAPAPAYPRSGHPRWHRPDIMPRQSPQYSTRGSSYRLSQYSCRCQIHSADICRRAHIPDRLQCAPPAHHTRRRTHLASCHSRAVLCHTHNSAQYNHAVRSRSANHPYLPTLPLSRAAHRAKKRCRQYPDNNSARFWK